MINRYLTIVKYFLLILVSIFIFLSIGTGADSVSLAVIKKVYKDVKKKSGQSEYIQASTGDILLSGDQVQTGKGSLALIKFTDGSIVRLREQSLLTMTAEGQQGSLIKEQYLLKGSVGFDVQKQRADQFRLTSPTSVASIRGTKGKWSGGQGHDTLVVTEGLVNLKNKISAKDVDIAAGYIGFSDENGTLTSRLATKEELEDANNAVFGGATNELKLEMKDSKGNKKELKLRYKQ
jgi:hypothetical protein